MARAGGKIGSSRHRDEYVMLMQAGWSSAALERYAEHRFGEEITARTFRRYRERLEIDPPKNDQAEVDVRLDVMPDVAAMRARLLVLQMDRIEIDARNERNINKLFAGTGKEIAIASDLMTQLRADIQMLGLMPGGVVAAGGVGSGSPVGPPGQESSGPPRSLRDVLAGDPGLEKEVGRVIDIATREEAG